jgi:hypothetical protein
MKIQEVIVNEDIEIGDSFDIELGNIVIETGVVGFMSDGIIVEGDAKTLALLGISGALLENVQIISEQHAGSASSPDMQRAVDNAKRAAVQKMMTDTHGANYTNQVTPEYDTHEQTLVPNGKGGYTANVVIKPRVQQTQQPGITSPTQPVQATQQPGITSPTQPVQATQQPINNTPVQQTQPVKTAPAASNYMDTGPASVTAGKAKEFDQATKQAFKPNTPGYFDDEDPNPKKIPQSQHWADPNPNVQKTVQNYMNRNYMDSNPAPGAQDTQESRMKTEAKYHGREVPLGKKMAGDVKKSKVYVRGPNGNVVKVNFGDKNMRIKKSIPARRKSFRARHHCENPGPRWKARYWSCRSW